MKRSRWLLVATFAGVLLLAALSVAALAWSSDRMLNVVGTVLLVLQIAALLVVLNPQARGRLACSLFLIVSVAHTWLATDDRFASYVALPSVWNQFYERLVAESLPANAAPYLSSPSLSFSGVVVHLTSFWLGLAAALAGQGVLVPWRRRASTQDDVQTAKAKPLFQLSLRTLLVYTLGCGLALGWLVRERQRNEARAQAFRELEKSGLIGSQPLPTIFPWLRKQTLGDKLFQVRNVCLVNHEGLAWLPYFPEAREVRVFAPVSDDAMANVSRLRQLEELWIPEATITDDGVAHLSRLTQLQALGLSSAELSDDGLRNLAQLTQLRTLDLTWERHTDRGLQHLAGLKSMTRFHASTRKLTPGLLQWLQQNPQLEELTMGDPELSDDDLQALCSLTSLKTLNLWSPKITDRGVNELQRLGQLTEINLTAARITDDGVTTLTTLPNLKMLNLSGCLAVTDGSLGDLQQLQLDWLNLEGSQVTSAGLATLRAQQPELRLHPEVTSK